MRTVRLVATTAVAASALLFTSVGVSSADTGCPTSSANPIYAVACNTGAAADALAQEEAALSQELSQAALSSGSFSFFG